MKELIPRPIKDDGMEAAVGLIALSFFVPGNHVIVEARPSSSCPIPQAEIVVLEKKKWKSDYNFMIQLVKLVGFKNNIINIYTT